MAKPRWLDERQQRVWQGYLHLNQDLIAVLEQQLARESGLSGADYRVLHPLSEAPGGLLRARDLGSEIGWDRSRLSHQLSRMEKRGLGISERPTSAGGRQPPTVTASRQPLFIDNDCRYTADVRPLAELTELFRDQGLRVTPQRQCIFRLLEGNDRHPTAEWIYQQARSE